MLSFREVDTGAKVFVMAEHKNSDGSSDSFSIIYGLSILLVNTILFGGFATATAISTVRATFVVSAVMGVSFAIIYILMATVYSHRFFSSLLAKLLVFYFAGIAVMLIIFYVVAKGSNL